jgi:transposase
MRFEEIYELRTEKRLTIEEAAKMLCICERTFRRWCERYEDEGADGLHDKRLGRKACNMAPVDEVMDMLNLYESKYPNFTVAHFYEKWRYEHGGQRSYTWVKRCLQDHGLAKKAKKRGAHRRKRPRQPMAGMMLHQDGSSHEWIANKRWDLIVTMDDATNEIYSAFFVQEEGTFSSFRGVKEVIEKKGLFCTLYTDRGTHYWNMDAKTRKVDRHNLTQFGRALQQLGITMIAAYSPEARGRSERMFRTLQGRLPKELALAGIKDMDTANVFLRKKFIPQFNKRFTVKAREEQDAFVLLNNNFDLDDILCIQEQRIVGKDNTVSYKNQILQIPQDKVRYNYVKAQVKIHEHIDGSIAIFYGPRCLLKCDKDTIMAKRNKTNELKAKVWSQFSTGLLELQVAVPQPVDNC